MKKVGDKIVIEPLEHKLTLVALENQLVDKILREIDEEEKALERGV